MIHDKEHKSIHRNGVWNEFTLTLVFLCLRADQSAVTSPRNRILLCHDRSCFSFFCFLSLPQRRKPLSTTSHVPAIREAAAALAAGDFTRAEAELQAILQAAPADVHALNLLAIVRVQQKRVSEAEALFKQAIAIATGFRWRPRGSGVALRAVGKKRSGNSSAYRPR